MMKFNNVNKKYDDKNAVNHFSFEMPKNGIVGICGPSGCGKTTLLNIAAGLLDFEGSISFYGENYEELCEEELDALRAKNIGFIFQDYKLFEDDTVINNVLLPMDITSLNKRATKIKNAISLLKEVGLKDKKDNLVKELSGGEKQRVAVARSLANSPKVILADEPTGNLDSENSRSLMSLFRKIAANTLIILVSHDVDLIEDYCDTILFFKDGKLIDKASKFQNKSDQRIPLISLNKEKKETKLPLSFYLKHSFKNIQKRKFRSLFVLASTSISLLGVGLSTSLSNIISKNILKAYSQIIPTNNVVVTNKEKPKEKLISTLSFEDTETIKGKYSHSISHTGIHYFNRFEELFTDSKVSFLSNAVVGHLPTYNAYHFNEFKRISDIDRPIYPTNILNIDNDEVVLGLSYPTINEICFQLDITKSESSLSNYLRTSTMYLDVHLDNSRWNYTKDFSLKVAGITITNRDLLLHSSNNWNEYIFENKCGLSNTDIFNQNTKNPWDLKKGYYLEFKNNRDVFIKDILFANEYKDINVELLNSNYYKYLYDEDGYNRLVLFHDSYSNSVDLSYCSKLKDTSSNINSIILGNETSYSIYPESFMMGFSRLALLSKSDIDTYQIIDNISYIKYEESLNLNVKESVILGHFTKSKTSGVSFKPHYEVMSGRDVSSCDELVISSGTVSKLNIDNPINKTIYFSYPYKETLLDNGYLIRDYKTVPLKIVGVSNSQEMEMNHNEDWLIMFFLTKIGISIFDLGVKNLALDIVSGKEKETINILKKEHSNFDYVYPISSVINSVEKVCKYIGIGMLVFSFASTVIASLLMGLCNYLYFLEIKRDIGLVRCLGISKKESTKFIISNSLLLSLIAFFLSSIELIVVSFVLMKVFEKQFFFTSEFILNPFSLLYMFLLSILIGLFCSFLMRKKIQKLDTLDCLKA